MGTDQRRQQRPQREQRQRQRQPRPKATAATARATAAATLERKRIENGDFVGTMFFCDAVVGEINDAGGVRAGPSGHPDFVLLFARLVFE